MSDEDDIDEVYAEDHDALFEAVDTVLDERELATSYGVTLLLDIALRLAMAGYIEETEKPSSMGLKMSLDRLAKEFEQLVRDGKKDAAEFLERVKEAAASASAAAEEGESDDDDATPQNGDRDKT